jgi:ribosomal protein S6
MTNYELMMIVDPTLSDDERTDKINAVKTILENAGAKITNEDII